MPISVRRTPAGESVKATGERLAARPEQVEDRHEEERRRDSPGQSDPRPVG